MGFGRVVWSGIVGMVLLVPMAWLSFSFLNLTGSVTGGLITGLEGLFASIGGPIGMILSIVGGAILGLAMILFFPVHWALWYRPEDVLLLIALLLPWILACIIASAISAHSPRGGLHTSLAIGIGYAIIMLIIYFVLPVILNVILGGLGPTVRGLIDGLSTGLTDLPFLGATLLAILEASLVGGIFGAFIGSLKYKPEGVVKKTKSRATPSKTSEEPTFETSTDICPNCGAKLTSDDTFCTNCGQKV